jgi:hypothetical protein
MNNQTKTLAENRGETMKKRLDYALSVKVATRIEAVEYRCWYNARDAMLQLPGLLLFAWYVEGWLVLPKAHEVQVIEHGWVAFRDGRLLDPSIVLVEKEDQHLEYFPGIILPWQALQEIPPDTMLPLARLLSHRRDGLGHPDYQAAYDAAMARATDLAAVAGIRVQVCPRQTTRIIKVRDGLVVINTEE